MKHLRIDLREIPDTGLRLTGGIPQEIFDIGDEHLRPASDLTYDCELSLTGESLLVVGDFEAAFELECARCGNPFVYRLQLHGHTIQEELENSTILDLTNTLREDILLALPAYPHCDEGPDARSCPAADRFDDEDHFIPISAEDQKAPESRGTVWDALNDLKKDSE